MPNSLSTEPEEAQIYFERAAFSRMPLEFSFLTFSIKIECGEQVSLNDYAIALTLQLS
ncbi:hypothetical protein [Coleofasciculus sp.]|uniref:hypothetical protein n=1 Tax=Coleofasciculus sp. TaxID=3100458 RepID=UPI003A4B34B0